MTMDTGCHCVLYGFNKKLEYAMQECTSQSGEHAHTAPDIAVTQCTHPEPCGSRKGKSDVVQSDAVQR